MAPKTANDITVKIGTWLKGCHNQKGRGLLNGGIGVKQPTKRQRAGHEAFLKGSSATFPPRYEVVDSRQSFAAFNSVEHTPGVDFAEVQAELLFQCDGKDEMATERYNLKMF
jgi:hypothetical protein